MGARGILPVCCAITANNSIAPLWSNDSIVSNGVTISGRTWTPAATVVPIHDEDGNLKSDGRWDYLWDAENRLIQMKATTAALAAATASGIPCQKLDFAYDVQGRRVSKTVSTSTNGTTWTFASNQRFLYDGWNLIAEYSAPSTTTSTSLTLQATHVWGTDLSGSPQGAGGVGGLVSSTLISQSPISNVPYFPAYDGNGNISAWIDGTGTLQGRMDYSPFGQLIAQYKFTPTGNTTLSRLAFGFSTKYTDAESGLLYYVLRYYDPVGGRWLNRDPIEEQGGMNLYAFVRNNGVGLIDHLGLSLLHWHSYILAGHGDPAKDGSKLERTMNKYQSDPDFDKDHDRVSAVSCFNGDINKRFSNSIKSTQDRFDDPAIVNYFKNTNVTPPTEKANPKEPGFVWPKAPREVDVVTNPGARKIGDRYWLFDGADQAYALLEQKIIDAENQAEKDAEKPDTKCTIQVEVNCVSYQDFGANTTDFNRDVMNGKKPNLCGHVNKYNSTTKKWSKGKFAPAK